MLSAQGATGARWQFAQVGRMSQSCSFVCSVRSICAIVAVISWPVVTFSTPKLHTHFGCCDSPITPHAAADDASKEITAKDFMGRKEDENLEWNITWRTSFYGGVSCLISPDRVSLGKSPTGPVLVMIPFPLLVHIRLEVPVLCTVV